MQGNFPSFLISKVKWSFTKWRKLVSPSTSVLVFSCKFLALSFFNRSSFPGMVVYWEPWTNWILKIPNPHKTTALQSFLAFYHPTSLLVFTYNSSKIFPIFQGWTLFGPKYPKNTGDVGMTLFQIKWHYCSKHIPESLKASISQSVFSKWNGWPHKPVFTWFAWSIEVIRDASTGVS